MVLVCSLHLLNCRRLRRRNKQNVYLEVFFILPLVIILQNSSSEFNFKDLRFAFRLPVKSSAVVLEVSADPCGSCSPKHQSPVYTADIFKVAAGVFWFLTPLKGEVPGGLSWEGLMPAEHLHWGCSHRHSLALSSEIRSLCLHSLSSLSAIPEPVTVVSS